MKVFLLITLWFVTISGFTCDVCGCSLSGYSMGILPQFNSSFLGTRYSFAGFYAEVQHGNELSEYSNDTYHRFDLMGRWSVSKKIKLTAMFPVLYNSMNGNVQSLTRSGIGDPVVVVMYQLINDSIKAQKNSLFIGGGVKSPLGKFTEEDNGILVNPNFQMGSGSVDFLVTLNYLRRINSFTFSNEVVYKINTTNRNKYRFGNQLSWSANVMYFALTKQFKPVFYTGGFIEYANMHKQHNSSVFNTGGLGFYGNIGAQLYYRRMRFNGLFQFPIVQKFNTDNLTSIKASPRFSVDFIFFFGK